MLNYWTAYDIARLEQRLREQEIARAARYAERPVERHAAASGRHSKRGLLVTLAGLAGAAGLLLASAGLTGTLDTHDSPPLALLIVDDCC